MSSHSTSTESVSISRARSVDAMSDYVSLIVKSTVYPVCHSGEILTLEEHIESLAVS